MMDDGMRLNIIKTTEIETNQDWKHIWKDDEQIKDINMNKR